MHEVVGCQFVWVGGSAWGAGVRGLSQASCCQPLKVVGLMHGHRADQITATVRAVIDGRDVTSRFKTSAPERHDKQQTGIDKNAFRGFCLNTNLLQKNTSKNYLHSYYLYTIYFLLER
ncbi:hypothetical protein [Limnohabitans sp. Rim8]|uniref:hypothetical protein n=1 Tax=Limnohabitans sp. Rim8 TaxID=1100718 RepID=UPI0025DB1DEA|nr:hypothetical protein [Limnohabitans sp. Rim8]